LIDHNKVNVLLDTSHIKKFFKEAHVDTLFPWTAWTARKPRIIIIVVSNHVLHGNKNNTNATDE